jgi:uncharacterized protein YkwD
MTYIMDTDEANEYSLDKLQKTALSLMAMLVLVTFVGANLQAVLWQSSQWLVSTVLPATVVDLTNQERSDLNATPLQRNATLDTAAELKAQHMVENEYFAHFSPDGVSPWHWFDEAGYVYAHAGENLAIHFTDSTELVDAWMKSPTHRENIIDSKYTQIGVGTAKGSYEGYDTVYVVQLFGAPGQVPVTVAQAPTPAPTPAPAPTAPATPSTPEVAAAQTPEQVTPQPASVPEPAPEPVQQPEPAPATPPVETALKESVAIAQSELTEEVTLADSVTPPVLVNQAQETEVEKVTEEPIQLQPSSANEAVVVNKTLIATSSGLAVANITVENPPHAGATSIASFATKPNSLLQLVYLGLGMLVFLLLTASLVMEARQLRFVQVAYSLMLLFGMGGLWFLNSVLTSGAVIT